MQPHHSPQEGALRVLGLLCASAEPNRRQLVECRVLPQLAAALAEAWPPLRAAACLCMRSLSRSTNLLRWGGVAGESLQPA